jgi:hypothetical protein
MTDPTRPDREKELIEQGIAAIADDARAKPYDPTWDESGDPDLYEPAEEDRDFLSDWYDTVDEVAERRAAVAVDGAAVPPAEDRSEAKTLLEALRSYLLDSAGLDQLEPPRPLIDKVLFYDTPSWLIGRPGCGKSFLALDWAGHIGQGLPWCGFPTQKANVIYVMPESPGGVGQRKRAWEASMGRRMEGVFFLPVPVSALDSRQVRALTDLAIEKEAALIILDTQARMTVGLEENSSKDMGVFVEAVDHIRRRTGACVLTVHHTPRGGDHLRGSTALEGAAGTIITVRTADGVMEVAADPEKGGKTKDVKPFDPVQLRFVERGESVILALAVQVVDQGQIPATVERSLHEWWQQHGSEPVSASLLIRTEVFAERTFYNWAKKLVTRGVLTKSGKGNQTRYAMVEGSSYAQ